jgi:hypothetical protein
MDFLQLVGTEGAVDSDSLTRPLVNLFEQAGESLVTVTLLQEREILEKRKWFLEEVYGLWLTFH